jgi:hypothetical protein
MSDTPDPSSEARHRRDVEYQDRHYHDEDEIVPVDDVRPRGGPPPAPRKPAGKCPPRRRDDADDE